MYITHIIPWFCVGHEIPSSVQYYDIFGVKRLSCVSHSTLCHGRGSRVISEHEYDCFTARGLFSFIDRHVFVTIFFYLCLLNRTRSIHYFIYIVVGRNHVFDLFQIRKKSLRQNLKQVSSQAYVLCYKAIFPYVKLLSTTALRQRARATLKLLLWSVCWRDFQ